MDGASGFTVRELMISVLPTGGKGYTPPRGCTQCTACTGCTGCSGCSGCSVCTGCSACSGSTGRYHHEERPGLVRPADLIDWRAQLGEALAR